MENSSEDFWRKCSSCKKTIAYGAKHFTCSVSTCNGQRTGYVFCSVPCFEVHLPGARHKDAAAMENFAPRKGTDSTAGSDLTRDPTRKIVASAGSSSAPSATSRQQRPREVLVIASRLKDYIQARSEMNTSAQVMDVLSDFLRVLCDRGMENARAEGRKTVLDRDFHFLKSLK